MIARSAISSSTAKPRQLSIVLKALVATSLLFSNVLYALPADNISAEPALIKDVQAPAVTDALSEVDAALAGILKMNSKCLKCHSKDKFKSLEDGEKLSLQVHKQDFLGSAHGEIACVGCHESIGNRKHPSKSTNIAIASQRDYSVELNQGCQRCHDKKYVQYEGSIHASLVGQGNAAAPVCTDCHSAHAVETMSVYQPVTGLPCKNCHEAVFDAYAASVHGEARKNGNTIRASHIQAPICSDCHRAHDITAVAVGDGVKSACIGCHEGVNLAHDKWLPNAGLHLDVVSCAACHAPVAERRIDLQLYDNVAQLPVGQHKDHSSFYARVQAIDEQGDSMAPLELYSLLGESTQEGQTTDVSLRGRMEVSSGIDAHSLASSVSAVRDCNSCHQSGSEAFQNVMVSISRPDGRTMHYEADKETLNSVVSVASVSNFYALGGTRIKLLDGLLMLGLISGFAIPIGHFTAGRIIGKDKDKDKGEQ